MPRQQTSVHTAGVLQRRPLWSRAFAAWTQSSLPCVSGGRAGGQAGTARLTELGLL